MNARQWFELRKLRISNDPDDDQVRYRLATPAGDIDLNQYIGQSLRLETSGQIHCIECSRRTKKSFNRGYCYPCFIALAACDRCITSPQLCHYHLGTCRQPRWGDTHCMQPHIVYLANTSGLKVGISRKSRVATRWLDQGASAALMILEVASRLLSGKVELSIAQYAADRTDWRRLLRGNPAPADLLAERDRLLALCSNADPVFGDALPLPTAKVNVFRYPVRSYPPQPKAINLDKTPVVEGILEGMKGQYLILDNGVLNVWRYVGYQVSLQLG